MKQNKKLNDILLRVHEFIGATVGIDDQDTRETFRENLEEISEGIQAVQDELENSDEKPVKPRKPRKKQEKPVTGQNPGAKIQQ